MWYGRDYNTDYNADYNSKYNAKYVTKWYDRECYPEWDPESDSAIHSYSTTVTIDDTESISESTPNQAHLIDITYAAVWD